MHDLLSLVHLSEIEISLYELDPRYPGAHQSFGSGAGHAEPYSRGSKTKTPRHRRERRSDEDRLTPPRNG
jgi:hypothetical protein